jgi:hypothetical protein
MEGQYLNIPFGILFNPKLTSDEKLILAEIVSLDKLRNGCTAGDNHFAKIINKTRQTTNGIIKKLETKGLLEIKVKPGIGKKTKPGKNFWELIAIPVGDSDTTCRDSLQVGVEIHDTTCRDSDTTNTITNTDILIQEELHYTGATDNISVEINDCRNKEACSKLNELINTDPATISNLFLIKFQNCCGALDHFLGSSFFDNCHIFKSNKELYDIYGFSNFFEVRMDLIFVRENMNRFLRQGI